MCFTSVVDCLKVKMYSYLKTYTQALCFKHRSQLFVLLKIFLEYESLDHEVCMTRKCVFALK